jgi:glycosyltransferase involved in cell wall biosynthesis
VVLMGIDLERFTPQPLPIDERLPAELGLPERFVVYPANLWPHKNHERLVEGLARIRDPELGLVLTGRDYGRLNTLKAHASALGVGNRILHLGYVERDAVPALYRLAEAMVFPSLYEGFGAPPLEAMACGCPVASSRRASLAEVVGDAAAKLEPESVESIAGALETVSEDEEARSRLRSAGLQRAQEFSWSASAERHTAIYARACATSGAPVH